MTDHRIGLIVPSSNTTMETEVPELLHRHWERYGDSFTCHSSRAPLHTVDAESLHAMVGEGDRCARELSDAQVDAIGYACLIALMAEGSKAHERVERHLAGITADNGYPARIVSSAGALVRTISDLGLRRVALVAPYVPDLTRLVVNYLGDYGIEVVDELSLGVTDNCAVGRLDTTKLIEHAQQLNTTRAEGIVLSACVQMPSLPVVADVEHKLGLPVVTAATATTRELLAALELPAETPTAGAALASSGRSA